MKGFIPYGRQNITNEDIQSVIEVLKSNLITQGPVITEFEKSVSKKVKSNAFLGFIALASFLYIV